MDINNNAGNSSSSRDVYCGNVECLSLSYVEVRPLPVWKLHSSSAASTSTSTSSTTTVPTTHHPPPALTGALLKRQLMIDTHRSSFSMTTTMEGSKHGCIGMNHSTSHVIQASGSDATRYLISGSLMRLDDDDDNDDDDVVHCEKDTSKRDQKQQQQQPPVLWFTTNEPFGSNIVWPCHCVGYTILDHPVDVSLHTLLLLKQQQQYRPVIVSESTLVVVILSDDDDNEHDDDDNHHHHHNMPYWKDYVSGEIARNSNNNSQQRQQQLRYDAILQSQNTTTIAELKFRIQQLLFAEPPIYIGTTGSSSSSSDISNDETNTAMMRARKIRSSIRATTTHYSAGNGNNTKNINATSKSSSSRRVSNDKNASPKPKRSSSTLLRDVALLVHSPYQNDDKTGIIEAIVSKLSVKNTDDSANVGTRDNIQIHILQPGLLFAKYGIYTDVALQCILHTIILQAAVRQQRICIIFDHFNSMILSSGASDTTTTSSSSHVAGDAAIPILQSITSYIQTLLRSIQNDRVIPFPRNNPLYGGGGGGGMKVPVYVCFIAVMTCPDAIGGGATTTNTNTTTTFFSGMMGLYRLPNTTSETRWKAFRYAFQQENIVLSHELEIQLPYLAAASAIWARGATTFQCCAKQLRSRILYRRRDTSSISDDGTKSDPSTVQLVVATIDDVQNVFHSMKQSVSGRSTRCDVQFLPDDNNSKNNNESSLFDTVGGTQEAKASLLDALCLDPIQRTLLSSFGITPSTGVLLYGPPGTGKTLLAKAVAKALRARSSSTTMGGAFISLNSSDVVRAEVGVSEQLVVQAFHTARTNSPAVIFIDEFQALFTERSSTSSSRLTTTLLQCMDDMKGLVSDDSRGGNVAGNNTDDDGARVLVLAATNTPWMIDRAFLRPGRFDRSVLVNLPNLDDRISILRLLVKRMKTTLKTDSPEQQSFLEMLAHRTDGFSGADLAALCRAAAIRCLVDHSEFVVENHFLDVLDNGLNASSSISLVKKIEQWRP